MARGKPLVSPSFVHRHILVLIVTSIFYHTSRPRTMFSLRTAEKVVVAAVVVWILVASCMSVFLESTSMEIFDSHTTEERVLRNQSNAPNRTVHQNQKEASYSQYPQISGRHLYAPNEERKSVARNIVERAYQKSYKIFETACPKEIVPDFKVCLQTLHNTEESINVTSNKHYPWWFETVLRDSTSFGNGLWGSGHQQRIHAQPIHLQQCSIPKVASNEWRKVACLVDGQVKCRGRYKSPPFNDTNVHKSVFLRDPLERFLSAFLDKCVHKNRKTEQHCEPLAVFLSDHTKEQDDLVSELLKHAVPFFEAYVDTFPLHWNLHFFPQSFFCDLARDIGNYQFVGQMGDSFKESLIEWGERYHISQHVDNAFHTIHNDTTNARDLEQRQKRSRKASTEILKYFSAKTVQRLLEIYSIDYVRLGLPIPTWAESMIEEEYNALTRSSKGNNDKSEY